jgi:hypothetical protein
VDLPPRSFRTSLLDEKPSVPPDTFAELRAWCVTQPEIEAAYLSRQRDWHDSEPPTDVTTLALRLVGTGGAAHEREIRLLEEALPLLARLRLDTRRVTFLADAGWPPVRERALTIFER